MKVSAEIRTIKHGEHIIKETNVIFKGEGTFENGILSTDKISINTKEMAKINDDVNAHDERYVYIKEVAAYDYSKFIFVKDVKGTSRLEDFSLVIVINPILLNTVRGSLDTFLRSRGIESEDIAPPYASPVYLYDTFDDLCTSYMEYFKEEGKPEDLKAFNLWVSGWKSIIKAMGETL